MYKVLKKSKGNRDNIFFLLEKRIKCNPKNKEDLYIALDDLEQMESQIKSLCDIRDKFYAHLDKKYIDYLKNKSLINDLHNIIFSVECAIVALSSKEKLQSELNGIESRMDYSL
jgi:hypothetical protein